MQSHMWHKKNIMANIMSLNSRIFFVVGLSVFVFDRHLQVVFDLVDLNISQTFKQLVQAKTINAEKNKSDNQW